MNTKIINIIYQLPPYALYKENKPSINFNTPDGSWVGIWENDIPDLVTKDILKASNNSFEYEIWRPDLRADKIYFHTFKSGIKSKLFPAKMKKKFFGLKRKDQISSPAMLEYLKKKAGKNTILHLHTLGNYLNQEIIRRFRDLPKVINFHGKATSIPAKEMLRPRKNIFSNFAYFKYHRELVKNKKTYFVYQNSANIEALSKYHHLGIDRIFTGVDFNHLKKGNKVQAKKELGINPGATVFSMASRFVKLKQIDKIIEILTEIDKNDQYDFLLNLVGHGEKDYEEYLKRISADLLKKKKLKFPGYLAGEGLLKLYQASDLFISASTSEGGPTSVIKAIACETPVFCTRVRGVDDILEQYHAGVLVDRFDYKKWRSELISFLEKRRSVNLMDRNKAIEMFHWPNAAKKYIKIYEMLS